jgi:hypothetical protein
LNILIFPILPRFVAISPAVKAILARSDYGSKRIERNIVRKTQPDFVRYVIYTLGLSQIGLNAAMAAPAASAAPPTQYSQTVHTVLPGADDQTISRNGALVAIDRAAIPAHRDTLGDWPAQPAQRIILNLATHHTVTRALPAGLPDCAHPGTMDGDIGDSFGDPFISRLMAAPANDVGKGEVNGMPAEIYRVQLEGQAYTLWREPSRGLVLKVTSTAAFFGAPAGPDGQTTYYEVKHFAIGPADPALFALPETCRKAISRP